LLMVGAEVGAPALAGIEQALGVTGALVVADRIVARGSNDAAVGAALETARAVAEGTSARVGSWLARGTFPIGARCETSEWVRCGSACLAGCAIAVNETSTVVKMTIHLQDTRL